MTRTFLCFRRPTKGDRVVVVVPCDDGGHIEFHHVHAYAVYHVELSPDEGVRDEVDMIPMVDVAGVIVEQPFTHALGIAKRDETESDWTLRAREYLESLREETDHPGLAKAKVEAN